MGTTGLSELVRESAWVAVRGAPCSSSLPPATFVCCVARFHDCSRSRLSLGDLALKIASSRCVSFRPRDGGGPGRRTEHAARARAFNRCEDPRSARTRTKPPHSTYNVFCSRVKWRVGGERAGLMRACGCARVRARAWACVRVCGRARACVRVRGRACACVGVRARAGACGRVQARAFSAANAESVVSPPVPARTHGYILDDGEELWVLALAALYFCVKPSLHMAAARSG
eukprot:6024749-Pleurochrysis_carterae.AAC.3